MSTKPILHRAHSWFIPLMILATLLLVLMPISLVRAEDAVTFPVGSSPIGICFDGVDIWVTNGLDDTVSKLRASDGTILGTYGVGDQPWGICFDGVNIWVANHLSDTVTKLRAGDGTTLGTYGVGHQPTDVCFDGVNIWVTNYDGNSVSKLRASDGTILGTYGVGGYPAHICFDGVDIWVTNQWDGTVMKLRVSDGTILGTYGAFGGFPSATGICFDGVSIWVTNFGSNSVSKLRASDGTILGTYGVGSHPEDICFDGVNIWVANMQSNNVTKLRASDGTLIGTYGVGSNPFSICFDGVNIWVANNLSNTVTKLMPSGNTPVGSPVTVPLNGVTVTFDTVTAAGDTSVTSQQGNPYGTMPEGFTLRGQFVDITTTATYDPPVTVGISYAPSTPNPQNLKLFHWEGGHWVDVTTSVDTTNHIVYGEVTSFSWFFIGGEWVWVDDGGSSGVPVFPSIHIGIGAALGAGILAYFVRRRLAA